MKRTLSITVFSLILLSSCKKDFVCTCTFTPAGSTVTTYSYDMKNIKEKEAKDACNQLGAEWINAGGTCDFR